MFLTSENRIVLQQQCVYLYACLLYDMLYVTFRYSRMKIIS